MKSGQVEMCLHQAQKETCPASSCFVFSVAEIFPYLQDSKCIIMEPSVHSQVQTHLRRNSNVIVDYSHIV